MEHLYSSRVKVQRLQHLVVAGKQATFDWVDQPAPLNSVPCRLDLIFVRPGRDVLPAHEAGVARSRIGIMFCAPNVPLLAGDRIVTIAGPENGTFEIRNIPDKAQDSSSAHHIEVQIVETNQTLDSGDSQFPSEAAPPEPTPPLAG